MSDLRARQGDYKPWRPIEEKSHNQTVFIAISRVLSKTVLSKTILILLFVVTFISAIVSYQFLGRVAETSAAIDDYIAKLESEIGERQIRVETFMESIESKKEENVELHQINTSLEFEKRELSEKAQKNDQMRVAKEKENIELRQINAYLESEKRELSEKAQKNDQMRVAKEKENLELRHEIDDLVDLIREKHASTQENMAALCHWIKQNKLSLPPRICNRY